MSTFLRAHPDGVLKGKSKRGRVAKSGLSREHGRQGFLISTDKSRLNIDLVHDFLSKCYWAKGIPREVVARSIRNSLCFGLYQSGKQVGFARVISDYATYAYLGDVFVLDEYRGWGLGKWVMKRIMEHPRLQGLRRWSLVTRDAHGLYSHFGFGPLSLPERHMEIHRSAGYNKSHKITKE